MAMRRAFQVALRRAMTSVAPATAAPCPQAAARTAATQNHATTTTPPPPAHSAGNANASPSAPSPSPAAAAASTPLHAGETPLTVIEPTLPPFHRDVSVPMTPESVAEGLQHSNAHACPFLREVDQQRHTPAARQQLSEGGATAARAMRAIADAALARVLDDLRSQKRYREFRYFRRAVGQHPEVLRVEPGVGVGVARRHPAEIASLPVMPGDVTTPSASASTSVSPSSQSSAAAASGALINWCSNDYLNLAHHPDVLTAMTQALHEQGAGAGGTRNISGSNVLHIELERELASLCGTEAALLFSSCYVANLGVMEALSQALGPKTIVFSDRENHASLVQGIRNTRLPKQIFDHNDVEMLERQLAAADPDAAKIVVFESVYSMSGTRSPIKEILDVCDAYGAISVVDEVHAVGLYGPNGAGVLDELGLLGRADIVTGTLGKAFGVGGGFVASRAAWVDVIRSTAPAFIFTTSLSPVMTAGATAAVRVVRRSPMERAAMQHIAGDLKRSMLDAGLPLMSQETHIMPLFVGDGDLCKVMADELLERGIYVQPINFPSVPRGEELLRFTASPKHTPAHCEHLLSALVEIFGSRGMLRHQREAVAAATEPQRVQA